VRIRHRASSLGIVFPSLWAELGTKKGWTNSRYGKLHLSSSSE
jgi:hypothetical protein